jgi:GTPase
MFIDETVIHVKAGHGGPGKVCFSTIPRNMGPTGGNGGVGGSVYVLGVSDLSALRQYRFKKDFSASDGTRGGESNRTGAAGADLVLKVPIGTVIHVRKVVTVANEEETQAFEAKRGADVRTFEVTTPGEKILIAKGGKGGKGNFAFRSSRNPSPLIAQPGLPGDEFEALFELQLIADVGLIGLPNAGKSSLLNELTKAGARVANYPFTTLEPNLGVFYPDNFFTMSDEEQAKAKPIILADVPGLIEGASAGKGLGFKFLRHIQRTKVLFHCVSAESQSVNEDYKAIRAELTKYDKALAKKKEYILLTKSDLVDEATLKKQVSALKRFKKPASPGASPGGPMLAVSIHNPEQMEELKELLSDVAK